MTPPTMQERRAAQLGGLAVRGEREKARRDGERFKQTLTGFAVLALIAIVLALAPVLGVSLEDRNLNSNDYANQQGEPK